MTRPWLLVAGDLTPLGGMDAANHALARYLGERGTEVHVVTHRAWPDLRALPGLTLHEVWRPFGHHVLGSPLLACTGRRVCRDVAARRGVVVANGGNCDIGGVNWVHYVHAAHTPEVRSTPSRRAKARYTHRRDLAAEQTALRRSRLVICNSRRTACDVIERVGVDPARIAVIYYGSAPDRFGPVASSERSAARHALGRSSDRPLVGFVGALGDRRKAFDVLFESWAAICRRPSWDADLLVVGAGSELAQWRERAKAVGLASRITFLGFRPDVPAILAALDALVHPARYEAYGLSVHEAICRGVPALVSASAGVAERYTTELRDLLIRDPEDPMELVTRLWRWRDGIDQVRAHIAPLADRLRRRTWDAMAEEIVERAEQAT